MSAPTCIHKYAEPLSETEWECYDCGETFEPESPIAPGAGITVKGGPVHIVGTVVAIVGQTASVKFRNGRVTSWLVRDLAPVVES